MSVLLGMYVNMELNTSEHTVDSSKVSSKLLSALWIYLSHSEKHIFRVLLKLEPVIKKYSEICEPIFKGSFANLKDNTEPLTDVDYVRYLLALKMWGRMRESVEEKKEVNKIALTILGPYIPKMRDDIFKIILKPPHENETIWLLQSNVFDLKAACNNFTAFEEASIESEDQHSKIPDVKLQSSQCASYDVTKSLTNYESKRDESRRIRLKRCKKVSKLKPKEMILIDLTEDDESKIEKKKSKKGKRTLEWLKITKKQRKKKSDEEQCMNQVEIADAHSTENVTRKILLENLPISDNKVSESTETCAAVEDESMQDDARCNSQSVHNHIFNNRNSESKCTIYHKQCDTRPKVTDTERNKIAYLLEFLSAVAQNIKEPKAILNLLRESIEENLTSSQHTNFYRNTENKNIEPKCSIETLKECQNNLTNVQSIKPELPANGDFTLTEEYSYCQNDPVYAKSDFQSANSHDTQATDIGKEKVYRDVHEYADYYKKHEMKPFSYNNNIFNTIRNEDTMQNAIDNDASDKKLMCDDDMMCMLSDLDKCMDVLNRVGEHIMNVHAAKQRLECLDKTDACAVSTTVSGDQVAESSSDWLQTIGSLNAEKLARILESYEKEDLPRICSCQEFTKQEASNVMFSHVKCESDNCENVMVSTSRSNEYRSCGNDIAIFPENKSPSSFTRSHAKSEFEYTIIDEDNESFEVVKDKAQKPSQYEVSTRTNNQVYDSEGFIYDLEDSKESNQDWEITLPNFSQKSNGAKSRSPVNELDNDNLNSILNQSITIEDEQEIWDESQSLLVSPMSYDVSSTVLNCITEIFSQSENQLISETEEEYALLDTKNYLMPLPEGSLGITGILSSLHNNDFMCTNVQPVNTRLSKNIFKDEIDDNTEPQTAEEAHTDELKNNISPSEKEKATCTSRNADKQLNCVDVQQMRNASQQKRQVLVSNQEDYGMDTVSTEDFVVDAEYIAEENSVNANALREKPRSSGSKLCNRFSKRHKKFDVTKVRLATDKYATKVSNNILVKPSANTQPSELTEKQLIAAVEENTSPKKRRLTSNLSSRLQRNTVCKIPMNQQKLKKRSVPTKKGNIYFILNIQFYFGSKSVISQNEYNSRLNSGIGNIILVFDSVYTEDHQWKIF
ncbi:uncharacterized protein LOC108630700 [Ceratina calcarata]|uniref:Uncharacterized protein LOC108630700 n=1 Tax=Ceratina calcarata TaxID=156304 RepID=A0AAJ7JCM7_9HYME|nr:uncharacterized protein LOC108630700 [Ceratina calcarata]